MLRRIRIHVCYDGTAYHGWQSQRPELPTIQSALEAVLAIIEGKPVIVAGSGRTDAGVHALAQVAAFDLNNGIPCDNLRKALNRLLPEDIRVVHVQEMHTGFHPRFDAISKTYEYRVWRPEICPPVQRRWVHHHPYPMKEQAIIDAAPLLVGRYDFAAFAASDPRYEDGRSMVRTIFSSVCTFEGDLMIYRVCGNGFLKHMVRNIVGVLLQVGYGNVTRATLLARLQPNCGIPAGPRAPARGLCLVSVDYPVSELPSKTSQ